MAKKAWIFPPSKKNFREIYSFTNYSNSEVCKFLANEILRCFEISQKILRGPNLDFFFFNYISITGATMVIFNL